jgi:hypothetical protein
VNNARTNQAKNQRATANHCLNSICDIDLSFALLIPLIEKATKLVTMAEGIDRRNDGEGTLELAFEKYKTDST